MKLVSWNVNGLRACAGKGFIDFFRIINADIFCVQETKLQPGQIELELDGYTQYFNSAEKKGYSGTAVFTRPQPLDVSYGIGIEEHDREGRVITADYGGFYLVKVSVPNAQRELTRLDYRVNWEEAFRDYVCELDKRKPVIICGDMNVAHREIDLKNYSSNRGNAGFTDEERACFSELLDAGFVDTFRHVHGDIPGMYTWWSYMFNARANNAGWRIDYFLTSRRIADKITGARIHADIFGSDHCPVELEIEL
ncbi:MAG: exodeoxyribonuclease III [Clostridia bacterium]|nr:exodeoxyribonuclease III [Clostridia bacterium]